MKISRWSELSSMQQTTETAVTKNRLQEYNQGMKKSPRRKQGKGIVDHGDEEATFRPLAPFIPPRQHLNRLNKRNVKKIPRSQERVDLGVDVPSQSVRSNDDVRIRQEAGAFPVAGRLGRESSIDVSSLSGTAEATTVSDITAFTVLHARVVDDESPIVEATLMGESKPTETQHWKALLKSRKCRIISALTLALIVGVIVAVLLVTQNGSKIAPSSEVQVPRSDNETSRNIFLAELKPLLSNESMSAIDNPDSPQALSLGWLLERSNFQAWPFRRQLQRFAMATIYYATAGPTWTYDGNWLTNENECRWFQGSEGNFCSENGTLQYLNQNLNGLNGTIPDEIRLLSSLTVIDLHGNNLYGTIPADIFGAFTALQDLLLSNNLFTGTLTSSIDKLTSLQKLDLSANPSLSHGALPSEIGELTKLTYVNLFYTNLTNQIPTEIGLLTALQWFSLGENAMTGTIPTQIFECSQLSALWLKSNSFTGTLPSEFGSLTASTLLYLDSNSFTGTVPSELGSLSALTVLTIDRNDFNGTVPSELCNLGTVEIHRACGDVLTCASGCCMDVFCS
jgi:Leucine rich repeat